MTMEATRYDDGTISYPGHPRSRNGAEPVGTIDLSEHTAEVVTWTTSTATPPGVREPNHLAIVEFDVGEALKASEDDSADDGEESVRALVQLADGDVETGDEVEPVYTEELREPGAGIREPESQDWDGYRFESV